MSPMSPGCCPPVPWVGSLSMMLLLDMCLFPFWLDNFGFHLSFCGSLAMMCLAVICNNAVSCYFPPELENFRLLSLKNLFCHIFHLLFFGLQVRKGETAWHCRRDFCFFPPPGRLLFFPHRLFFYSSNWMFIISLLSSNCC